MDGPLMAQADAAVGGFVTDASEFYACIGRLESAAAAGWTDPHMNDAGEEIANIYSGEMRERFLTNSAGGGSWPDIKPDTKIERWRKAVGGFRDRMPHSQRVALVQGAPFPILYITGQLYTSLVPGAPENILAFDSDAMVYGTSVFHAPFHQNPSIPGRPPQRQILVMPGEATLQREVALLANALNEIASGN